MRLINEVMTKLLEYYNDFQLHNQYALTVVFFYKLYMLSLIITKLEDKEINKKNKLIQKVLLKDDTKTFSDINVYIQKDMAIVNEAFKIIQEQKEEGTFFGDYDQPDIIAVGIYE